MDLLALITLPHWLMIAGAVLVAIGFVGLQSARDGPTADYPAPLPGPQLPSLPRLLDFLR